MAGWRPAVLLLAAVACPWPRSAVGVVYRAKASPIADTAFACRSKHVRSPIVASTATSPVEVYSTLGCPYCVRAKKTLSQLGVPYVEHDVTGDEVMRADVAKRAMRTSVPQIFIAGTHLGGCDDLLAAVESGRLAAMLEPFGIVPQQVPEESAPAAPLVDQPVPPELRPRDGILNHLAPPPGPDGGVVQARGASEIASSLQRQILALYDEFVTPDGARVDYARMRLSSRFQDYVRAASELRALAHSALPASHGARLAFWLNLYNALVIHGMAVVGTPAGREERGAFYGGSSGVAYDVGGARLTLDDIEHGIVRGSPAGDARSFAPEDARALLVLPRARFDARIHFALNCGAKSCPPIKIYEAEQLDFALGLAAQAFCESTTRADPVERVVVLSKLFDWYAVDFGGGEGGDEREVLARVVEFLGASTSDVSIALRQLLADDGGRADTSSASPMRIEYDEYDWGANETE